MIRTLVWALFLMACLTAHAADHGRAMRFSDIPVATQNQILETISRDLPWKQLGELTASDGTNTDYFGASVAIDANTVVVGAPLATVGGHKGQGAAYIFVKPPSGWENMIQVAKLTARDGNTTTAFGSSVAIDGNIVVVGASASAGAYLFRKPKRGWRSGHETGKLGCSSPAAISGDTVVCGYGHGAAVYVKPKTGWKSVSTYAALLTATDPGVSFFISLAIDQGVVVAGDYEYNNSQGTAYLFVKPKRGWNVPSNVRRIQTQTARLTASDGQSGDGFGWSVAIRGDTVAAGAPGHPSYACSDSLYGEAYIFVKPAGDSHDMTQTAELGDSNVQYYGDLGSSVAVSGHTLVAGNMAGNNQDNHQGWADVFLEPSGGWADTCDPDATLTASDGQSDDQFGISAAISGNTMVIGSNRSNIYLPGAAYVFGP